MNFIIQQHGYMSRRLRIKLPAVNAGRWELCPSSQLDLLQCCSSCPLNEGPGSLELQPLGSEGSHQNGEPLSSCCFCLRNVGEPFSSCPWWLLKWNRSGFFCFLAGAAVLSVGQMYYFELQCFYFSCYIIRVQAQKYAVKSQRILS